MRSTEIGKSKDEERVHAPDEDKRFKLCIKKGDLFENLRIVRGTISFFLFLYDEIFLPSEDQKDNPADNNKENVYEDVKDEGFRDPHAYEFAIQGPNIRVSSKRVN